MTDEQTAMVPAKTFEERMRDRIRDSIGELMSDEDLQKIVQRGIDEVFFKSHYVDDGRYQKREIPPLIHSVVKEVLSDRMKDAVEAWLQTHEADVRDSVAHVVEEGAGKAMVKALNGYMADSMQRLESDIIGKLQR